MIRVKDQLGNDIQLVLAAQRIVSLVPSLTEYLFDLGLEESVVGITKFCIKPDAWFKSKARVGGTKTVHIEKVKALQPDLIIANKEENTKEDIEQLRQFAPVYISDIHNFTEAYEALSDIGTLTGKTEMAKAIVSNCQSAIQQIKSLKNTKSCLYFIWQNPYMVSGSHNFINAYLKQIGLNNLLINQKERYPEVSEVDINRLQPDFILLSSEPFPFNTNHLSIMQKKFKQSKVILVDGEAFSWYGSRMAKTSSYFNQLVDSLTDDCR